MPSPSRRDFLRMATSGLLGAAGLAALGGLLRFLDFQGEQPIQTSFDVGEPSQYPVGSRTTLPAIPAMLLSTEGGFKALSLVCTHLGCTVEQADNGFKCPCHGSRYDVRGNVERGPARLPLRQLRVEVTAAGRLLVHTD
jgi:cytochrome b6-f complex iron-sulfur subunit